MNQYITGQTIKQLREQKKISQRELAEKIGVSDKTISKWETGKGYPDIELIEPLSKALQVSIAELFTGEVMQNKNRSANIRKCKYYVCPVCGNVIQSTGELNVNCCGVTLPVLDTEEMDQKHAITVSRVEDEYYITMDHEMSKEHYISFFSYVTSDHVEMKKMYPEQNVEVRFRIKGHGFIYAYCNKHGLFQTRV